MLARLLNTGLYFYNLNHPRHSLSLIKNLPDLQFIEIDEKDIEKFFLNFYKEIMEKVE
jgi:hypothetical protein